MSTPSQFYIYFLWFLISRKKWHRGIRKINKAFPVRSKYSESDIKSEGPCNSTKTMYLSYISFLGVPYKVSYTG